MSFFQLFLSLILASVSYAMPISTMNARDAIEERGVIILSNIQPHSTLYYVLIIVPSIIMGIGGLYCALRIAIWIACKVDDRKRETRLARKRAANAATTGGYATEDAREGGLQPGAGVPVDSSSPARVETAER